MYLSRLLQPDFATRKRRRILGLDSNTVGESRLERKFPIKGHPIVSVVLPVFNHAKYAPAAIYSVLSQPIDLELIIVDDGSTDNLTKAISHFFSDKRVKYFKKENGGLASALNLGFSHAVAPYLTWTSADNIYLPSALSTLVDTLIENPDRSLVYGNVELIDKDGRVILSSDYRPSDQTNSGSLNLTKEGETLFYFDDNFINSCFLYRMAYSLLSGEYRANLNGVEDYEYWLRLTAFSPPVHVKVNNPLYQYRLHEETMTSRLEAEPLAELTRNVRMKVNEVRSKTNRIQISQNLKLQIEQATVGPSPIIKRARDSDFRSLPEIKGWVNVGIVAKQDEPIKLEENLEANISIYPLDPMKDGDRLDLFGASVFNDHPEGYTEKMPGDEYRARSLMFWLSRLDYLLIPSEYWSTKELQYKASLAALAGLELRALRRNNLTGEELKYLTLFLPARHVSFYDTLSEATRDGPKYDLTREYLDKWLYSQSYNGILSIVKSGVIAQELEKVFP